MLLRKINAAISLLATFFLLDHAIFASAMMLSKGSIKQGAPYAPWILAGVMLLHAFISIYTAVAANADNEGHKGRKYGKMNRATIIQRISGLLMTVFAALHVAGAAGYMHPPKIVHAIVPAVFFTIALAHVAVSGSKAFITLGIGNAKIIKVIDVAIKIICAATLIAALAGFYLYKV